MKRGRFKSEADMAQVVVNYLNAQGFEVFQEVVFRDKCADIVARVGPLLWVIECKMSLGFDVVSQAREWREFAHFVSVAVPHARSRDDCFASEVLDKFDMSLITVRFEDGNIQNLRPHSKTGPIKTKMTSPARSFRGSTGGRLDVLGAPFRRRIFPGLSASLHEAQKTFAPAGSAASKRWTPFKDTCEKLRQCVCDNPGITLKEALGHITHHYQNQSSACACLSRLIEAKVVQGIELRREGKNVRLWPKE